MTYLDVYCAASEIEQYDDGHRGLYVAATRAKRTLYIG